MVDDDYESGDHLDEHTFEVRIPIDDLTQMMSESLALPWLEVNPECQVTSHR